MGRFWWRCPATIASACFKTAMICASLNRSFFIENLLGYLAEKILRLNQIILGPITDQRLDDHFSGALGPNRLLRFRLW
jgi:hypothetical protein